jgi:hypothetical protein
VAKFRVATCYLPNNQSFPASSILAIWGQNDANAWYYPLPHTMQNIENKEEEKVFLRKIFHPKELDVKILIRKELRRKMRPILELQWEEVVAK